ncbi:AAA family ATPase [Leifsonia poae]|uniref:AAA family ATPase n=1 Tax=Leifsonia poae TaxID=110933 RepID=UPI003D679181
MTEQGDRLYDDRPVRRVRAYTDAAWDAESWPGSIPAVAQVLRDGLELARGVTFLIGENGSGKSTLVEGIAAAYGLPPEGGSNQGSHVTRASESPLGSWLQVERSVGAPKWGFFLRAETMHGYYTYLESLPGSPDANLHSLSHGESFNDLLENKLNHPHFTAGLVVLDEPEAALSFGSTLEMAREPQRDGESRNAGAVRDALADSGLATGRKAARSGGVGHPGERVGGAGARAALAVVPRLARALSAASPLNGTRMPAR